MSTGEGTGDGTGHGTRDGNGDGPQQSTRTLDRDFQRVHPISPLLRVGIFIVAGIVASWRQIVDDFEPWIVLLTIVAFVVVGLVYGVLAWWFTRFRIDSEELRIDSGVIMRRSRRISIARLQAVDVVQPLLARLFGMAEVRFEVAGGSRTEAPLAYLTLSEARRLRGVLLDRQAEHQAAQEGVAPPEEGVAPATAPPSSPYGPPSPYGQQPPYGPPPQWDPYPPDGPPAPAESERYRQDYPVPHQNSGGERGITGGYVENPTLGRPPDATQPAPPSHPRREIELARVDPTWLVVGTLLSTEFLFAVAFAFLAVVISLVSGEVAGLALVFPALIGAASVLIRGIVNQWGFVLTDTGRGWRLRSGMFDLRSQTVPLDRVQGIALVEPLMWRRLGWVQVQVDVAGYAGASQGQASTLLPVAPRALALAVMSRLVPGGPATDVPQRPAPRQARWFRPVGWRYLGVGTAGPVVVTTQGWLKRRTDIVPHHKTQSVRVRQGPLQRRLGLVDVRIQTTPGPVDALARHRPTDELPEWVTGQLERAASAREARTSRKPDTDGVTGGPISGPGQLPHP